MIRMIWLLTMPAMSRGGVQHDRDWDQFHTPANLAKSISIEANELLECFQWDEEHYDRQAVSEELADPACDSAGTLSALRKLRLRMSGQRSGKKVIS